MKAAAVIIMFLTVCGIASASLVQSVLRQSTDDCTSSVNNVPPAVFSGCANTNSYQALCTNSCWGAVCSYWRNNDLGICAVILGRQCSAHGASSPLACSSANGVSPPPSSSPSTSSGALALVTIKGVLVVVLLLAAFFIL